MVRRWTGGEIFSPGATPYARHTLSRVSPPNPASTFCSVGATMQAKGHSLETLLPLTPGTSIREEVPVWVSAPGGNGSAVQGATQSLLVSGVPSSS